MKYEKSFTVGEIETKKNERPDNEKLTKKLTLVGDDVKITISSVPEDIPGFRVGDSVELVLKNTQAKLNFEEVEEE